jgi:D-aspartate ligase
MQSNSFQLSNRFLRRLERSALPPAVVIGTGTTGLSIARALGRHGVPVIGVDDQRVSYTSYSGAFEFLRYEKLYELEVIDFLSELASALPHKPALFCSGDEHVLLLSRHGQNLKEKYFFELPDPENVEVLMYKHLFSEVASRKGWPIPQTHYCESMEELQRILPDIEFPVILKPHLKNRQMRTFSPQKSFRCSSREELVASYALLSQWEKEVVIQQWIPGGDDEIYFSFHYFDSDLNELITFEGKKIRQHIPECGSTSCAVGVRTPQVTDLSRQILTEMKSVGFCSVEYKRDPRTDKFYIMEPTVGRVNLQVGVAIANDVDIVSRAYFHLIGQPYTADAPATHHVKWVLIPQDLRSARFYVRRGDLTWKEYVKSLSGPKVFAPLHRSDYRLLFAFGREWTGKAVRALRRKLGSGTPLRAPGRAGT